MQRVAANDPTTYFKTLSTRKVKHIRLPAESTPEHPYLVSPPELKKYYVDGVMNPNRKNKETLKKLRARGITQYNATHGQQPEEIKGKVVKKDYFIIKKKSDYPQNYFSVKNKLVIDPAYTEKDTNDPNGFLVCTYKDSFLYLLDFFEEWLEYPEALDRLDVLYRMFNCNGAYIENKASGLSLAQGARKMKGLNAVDYEQSKVDKKARLIDKLPMFEAKRIVLVYDDSDLDQVFRLDNFVSMLTQFPDNSIHDEAVDTIVMAIDLCESAYEREWN